MKRMYLLLLIVLMSTALVFAQDAQTMPETETEQPETTDQTGEGELGAGEGEAMPETPEAMPETEMPETEPTVPETGEGELGAGEGEAMPETPEAMPETPEAMPETPEAMPETPEAMPETPEAMPEGDETLGAGEMAQEVSFQDVQGYSIQSTDGTIKGNVTDAVVSQDGTVAYVVVELSEPAEFAGNQYLVPPVVAQLDAAQGLGTFDVQTADIAELPTLDTEMLGAGEGIGQEAQSYWQEKLGASFTAPDVENAALISEIMNYQVVGADQQQMGQISDIMIDLSAQEIASFSVSGGEALGAGEQSVEMDQAEIDTQAQTITVQEAGAMEGGEGTLGAGEPTTPEPTEPEAMPAPEETTPDATVPEPTVPETEPTVPETEMPETEPAVPETDGTLGAGEGETMPETEMPDTETTPAPETPAPDTGTDSGTGTGGTTY